MSKKAKIWLIVGVVLAALTFLLVPLIVSAIKKAKANKNGGTPPAGTKTTAQSPTKPSVFPLKNGSKGQEVKNLQAYLNFAGSYGLTVDGNFGSGTQSAVQQELSQPGGVPITTISLDYYNQFVVPYVNGTTIAAETTFPKSSKPDTYENSRYSNNDPAVQDSTIGDRFNNVFGFLFNSFP